MSPDRVRKTRLPPQRAPGCWTRLRNTWATVHKGYELRARWSSDEAAKTVDCALKINVWRPPRDGSQQLEREGGERAMNMSFESSRGWRGMARQVLNHSKSWEPVDHLQGSLGPSEPKTPKKSEKKSLGASSPRTPESLEKVSSGKSLKKVPKDFFETFSRLSGGGSRGWRPRETCFRLCWGFGPGGPE